MEKLAIDLADRGGPIKRPGLYMDFLRVPQKQSEYFAESSLIDGSSSQVEDKHRLFLIVALFRRRFH